MDDARKQGFRDWNTEQEEQQRKPRTPKCARPKEKAERPEPNQYNSEYQEGTLIRRSKVPYVEPSSEEKSEAGNNQRGARDPSKQNRREDPFSIFIDQE